MHSQNISASSLREKFLKFFSLQGHKVLPSSSLLPENDPTVLFATAGMQQFKRFYLFPNEASSSRITTCQKCVRTGDIDEVGDETHLTFFEMLGNFSFGYPKTENSYFKKEAIEFAWRFLTEELEIDRSRISATYFAGDKGVSSDEESKGLLQEITGLEDSRILGTGFSETFWSLGTEGSPGGPTVEFYVDGVEVWNLVFNQYVLRDGKYEPSEFRGVDTGMGFERLLAMMQNKSDIYQTDLFEPMLKKIEQWTDLKYGDKADEQYRDEDKQCRVDMRKDMRIILDHIRAAVFMLNDGIEPSNKGQGYILRRLIRRAIVKARNLKIDKNFTAELAKESQTAYPNYEFTADKINLELEKEELKFRKTLENGLRQFESMAQTNDQKPKLNATKLFDLYQTYGLPIEMSVELAAERNIIIEDGALDQFENMKREHQEKSRTASAGMFKGGLADNKIETTRLHTAAHLMLAALRRILGDHVVQRGSNITEERLRFDFTHNQKMSEDEIKKVENLVNEKIEENLPISMEEMNVDDAKGFGAMGVFDNRYGEKVKVYTIGTGDNVFSREICGGPHVGLTGELGHFKIVKEESSSSGVRRIKAVLS